MDDLISRQMAINEAHRIVIDGEAYDVVQVETLMGLPTIDVSKRIYNTLMTAVNEIGILDGDDIKQVFYSLGCVDDDLPTIDAAEVVRCKDCEHNDHGRCEMWEYLKVPDTGFCYEGVKK